MKFPAENMQLIQVYKRPVSSELKLPNLIRETRCHRLSTLLCKKLQTPSQEQDSNRSNTCAIKRQWTSKFNLLNPINPISINLEKSNPEARDIAVTGYDLGLQWWWVLLRSGPRSPAHSRHVQAASMIRTGVVDNHIVEYNIVYLEAVKGYDL